MIITAPDRDPQRRPRRTASGSVRGPARPGQDGAGQPDLRRGPARRRAGREDLGRGPAARRCGRGVPRRRSTTCRGSWRLRPRARSPARACSSITWCRAARSPGSPPRSAAASGGEFVLVLGHPYVDIWQAVRPERLGLSAWPQVPRDQDLKHGTCAALGWPARDQADIAAAWQMILGRVRSWNDLERPLLTTVEQLIDFVTQDHPVDRSRLIPSASSRPARVSTSRRPSRCSISPRAARSGSRVPFGRGQHVERQARRPAAAPAAPVPPAAAPAVSTSRAYAGDVPAREPCRVRAWGA